MLAMSDCRALTLERQGIGSLQWNTSMSMTSKPELLPVVHLVSLRQWSTI